MPAHRNAPLGRTCSAALAAGSFISDFLTTMSVSAARTRSSHTRWRNKLLPLSLRIDFPTVPYGSLRAYPRHRLPAAPGRRRTTCAAAFCKLYACTSRSLL
eukprot:scaffold33756_cov60-Phaeocystis_antarctica.AAC.2